MKLVKKLLTVVVLFSGLIFLVIILYWLSAGYNLLKSYQYASPEQLIEHAKVGEIVSFTEHDEFLFCEVIDEEKTQCYWNSWQDSNTRVIIILPKSKNISLQGKNAFEVKLLKKTDKEAITEIVNAYKIIIL